MWIYNFIILLIIIPPFFYIKSHESLSDKLTVEKIHISFCFVTLFFLSAFRGDFASDYSNYEGYFHIIKNLSISEILTFNAMEPGFVVLNKIISFFTNNPVWLFVFSTSIILVPIYKGIIKYSQIKWFSILLFLVIGYYYPSFNIVRSVIAASIVFAGSKYIYSRQFFKFSIYVLVATLFHVTAIFMVFFYFFLLLKPKRKTVVFYILLGIFIYTTMEPIVSFVDIMLFNGLYIHSGLYSGIGMEGVKVGNIIVPLAIGIYAIWYRGLFDFNKLEHRVWFNGTILWSLLSVLMIKVQLMTRIAIFFSPFVLLLIPFTVIKIKDKYIRTLTISALILLLIFYFNYNYSGSGYDPYYPIWREE